VKVFSGADAGREQSLKRLWTAREDKLCAPYGIDPKLMEYLDKVSEAAKGSA